MRKEIGTVRVSGCVCVCANVRVHVCVCAGFRNGVGGEKKFLGNFVRELVGTSERKLVGYW